MLNQELLGETLTMVNFQCWERERTANARQVRDVLDPVTALDDVDGRVHTGQHRADRVRITQPLEEPRV